MHAYLSLHPYIRTELMLQDFICIACFFYFWGFHFEDFMFRRVGGYEEQRREEHYRIDCHLKLLNTVNTSIYYYLTSPELGPPMGC